MFGVERKNQSVQEAPPGRGPVLEQPVHLRRQPDQMKMLPQCRLPFDRLAVDAHDTTIATVSHGIASGTDSDDP